MTSRLAPLIGAAVSALLLVAAFPPLGLWPLAWLALCPLYAVLVPKSGPAKAGAGAGFGFGLILYGAGLFWMNRIGAGPWVALAVVQAIFFALWAAATARIVPKLNPWMRPLAFAAGWTVFEWVRSSGPYAFPWFLLASAHARESALPWLQLVALTGQWGLSFAAAWGNAALVEGWRSRRARWGIGFAAVVASLGLTGWVRKELVSVDDLSSDIRRWSVAAVQGSEDRGTDRDTALSVYSRLTREAGDVDLVLWPEGTVPGDPGTRTEVELLAQEVKSPILAGMIETDGPSLRNTLRLFPETEANPPYAKRRLVPFGEFFPGRSVLGPVFARYGVSYPDFQPGARTGIFRIPDGPVVGTAICYESAFPWLIRDHVRHGARMLAFVTSDQTFEGTPELQQHLDLASVRAVESGCWVVRAGSTGITASVSPDGRVKAPGYSNLGTPDRLKEGERGALVVAVPDTRQRTEYVRFGDWFVGLSGLFCAAAVGFAWQPRRRLDGSGGAAPVATQND